MFRRRKLFKLLQLHTNCPPVSCIKGRSLEVKSKEILWVRDVHLTVIHPHHESLRHIRRSRGATQL